MTRRPTGTIIAPPMPWTKRAKTNHASELAIAQSSEPAMKMRMAVRKMVRAPKRSAIQPLTGMKTARLTR